MKESFKQNRQSAVKGRSSALIVTIIVHVVFFLVAGTYVAMEVIERQEAKFEAKQIARPKVKLKKLQVPVKIEQTMKRQAPKLSQRMTASSAAKTKSVDFKLPEVSGFGGGGGVNVSGGLGGSLGFATTQFNVFGLKSSGDKIVFLLDTSPNMLIDEIGGIPAYNIIKDELLTLLDALPPTALFNVIIFDINTAMAFSPELSLANDENLEKIKAWLGPLNSSKEHIGLKTLPRQGTVIPFEPAFPIMIDDQTGWVEGLGYAIRQGADSVYLMAAWDPQYGMHRDLYREVKRGKPLEHPSGWLPGSTGFDYDSYPGGKEAYDELLAESQKKYNEENRQREAAGQPLRVIPGTGQLYELIPVYFPGKEKAKLKEEKYGIYFTATDFVDYIESMQERYATVDRRSVTMGLKSKEMSLNVIHFVPKESSGVRSENLDAISKKFGGSYIQVKGLNAIKSSATAGK